MNSKLPGAVSGYELKLKMKKDEAAITALTVEIPHGYTVGGQDLAGGIVVGSLVGSFSGDNPWTPGVSAAFTGQLLATGISNEWELIIDYPNLINQFSVANNARPDKVHKITIIEPSEDIPGKLTIEFDRRGEGVEHNLSDEVWDLTLFGAIGGPTTLITNPAASAVYRWLGKEATTIDLEDTFDEVPGNQSVIIK